MTRHADTERTSAHYDSKAGELSNRHAARSVLRQFNNVVKSRLMDRAAGHVRGMFAVDVLGGTEAEAAARVMTAPERVDESGDVPVHEGVTPTPATRACCPKAALRAIDLCCGRGGDLAKWRALRPEFVFMTDASPQSVAEAAARYCCGDGMSLKTTRDKAFTGFEVRMAVHDVFDAASGLEESLRQVAAERPGRTVGGVTLIWCRVSLRCTMAVPRMRVWRTVCGWWPRRWRWAGCGLARR